MILRLAWDVCVNFKNQKLELETPTTILPMPESVNVMEKGERANSMEKCNKL